MTTLHVIRHGRAMAGAADYDRLHPDGAEQARLLGEYLRKNAVHFDAIYTGPLVRQRDTLTHMREGAGEIGAAWPAAVILAELAEVPLEPLARHCMTERITTDAKLQALMAELMAGHAPSDPAFFEGILKYVVALWVSGEVTLPGVESAPEFGRRVGAALSRVLGGAESNEDEERHVAIVTSNGVIGWLVGHAEREEAPELRCLHRRMFNASINRFRVRAGRLELDAWNLVDHLTDSRLRTIL
jgi:broad specificity phosphatase PhoE